jgi:hypothetical protein
MRIYLVIKASTKEIMQKFNFRIYREKEVSVRERFLRSVEQLLTPSPLLGYCYHYRYTPHQQPMQQHIK